MNATQNIGNETITCIVLNWNGGQDLLNSVRSLQDSQDVRVDVMVVDNGSSDGSEVLLTNTFAHVRLLNNDKNLGVAAAWNQAINITLQSGDNPVFFLNSDAVVAVNCLALLMRTLHSRKDVGIVTPRILDSASGRMWFDGGVISFFGDTVHHGFGKTPVPTSTVTHQDFASGCAMLVSFRLLRAVRFDERYFAYSEDADFSFRATQQGWRILHNPQALAIHRPSSSVKLNRGKWFRDYYVTRNGLMLGRRHLKGIKWILFLGHFAAVMSFGPIVYFILTGQVRRAVAVVQGVADFLRGRAGKRYG